MSPTPTLLVEDAEAVLVVLVVEVEAVILDMVVED